MEAIGLIKPNVATGGWQSPGYREFREFAPDLIRDETEGFGLLLQLLYDELALDALKKRREEWRNRRDSGEVTADAMMPIENDQEERRNYWVEQLLTKESVEAIPDSIRELKVLDPAVGSGHFLMIAFDLLAAFYDEEARHRGEEWTPRQIDESIIDNNLHGVDIDPRAVQIAAAALLLKARSYSREVAPRKFNLVRPILSWPPCPIMIRPYKI